jgi:hypothetical protein
MAAGMFNGSPSPMGGPSFMGGPTAAPGPGTIVKPPSFIDNTQAYHSGTEPPKPSLLGGTGYYG